MTDNRAAAIIISFGAVGFSLVVAGTWALWGWPIAAIAAGVVFCCAAYCLLEAA